MEIVFNTLIKYILFLSIISCSGQPSDEMIRKWTNNETGLAQLQKFVTDQKNPLDRRIFALQVLSDAGLNTKLRSILDACKTDADKVASGFAKKMLEQLKSKNEHEEITARDNLFIVMSFVPQQEQEDLKKAISDWAIGDLNEGDDASKVKSTIENKILISQIEELGIHGVKAALLLVQYGFKIEKMANLVLAQKDIDLHLKLLASFKKLHSMPLPDGKRVAVEFLHIDKIAEIKHPLAAAYLLDIASDKELAKDTRTWAFNKADILLESKEIKNNPKEVIPRLYKFLNSRNPDDRWDSALFLLKLEGKSAVEPVIQAFKDDGIYSFASEDPMKSIIDFCKDGLLPLKNSGINVEDVLNNLLSSKNRIQVAIGVVCHKVQGDKNSIHVIKPLLKQKKVSLKDFLGEESITLASLAQNAIDWFTFNNEIEEEIKTNKLSKEDGALKKFAFLVELEKTGADYKDSALKRFEADLKEKKEKEKDRK